MRTKKTLIGAFCLSMILTAGVFQSNVSAVTDKEFNESQFKGVKITKQNFPDSEVRKTLKKYDTNEDGLFSFYEQANILNMIEGYDLFDDYLCIHTTNKTIDLKGISKLKKVKKIEIRSENRAKLKIKNFKELRKTKVEYLMFTDCKIDKIDISNMSSLKEIYTNMYRNIAKINRVTIGNNPQLEVVIMTANNVKFGKCKKIDDVYLQKVKAVDIRKLKNLKKIYINSEKISKLDLKNNKELTKIEIYAPNLKNIGFSNKYTKLKKIDMYTCGNMKKVKFVNMKNLKKVKIGGCKNLKELDIENNPHRLL